MKFLIYILLFITLINAKLPIVLLKVDKNSIKVGEDVKVILSAKAYKNSNIKFPKLANIAGYGIRAKKENSILVKEDNKELIIKLVSYTITPDKSLEIPYYTINIDGVDYKTNSVKVDVKKPVEHKKSDGFIFRMYSDKSSVLVGESCIVTIELIEPIDMGNAKINFTLPQFRGFNVVSLGGGEVESRENSVIRKAKFLLTPKNSGRYRIKPAVVKIPMQLIPQAQTPFSFFGTDIQIKTIKSNPLYILVKPKPNDISLIGKYKIDAKVDKTKVGANKPVNLILTIEGEGNIEDFDEPKFNLKNVKIFEHDSNIEHTFENGKIYSRFTKQYTFVSNRDFTIPSISLVAYNSDSKKKYLLKTKPIDIKIKNISKIASILNSFSDSGQNIVKNSGSKITIVEDKTQDIIFDKNYFKKRYANSSIWVNLLYMLIGLIIGGLIGYFLPKYIKQKIAKKRQRLFGSYKEALNILYPHTNEDPEIEEMVKWLYEVVYGNSRDIKINDKVLKELVKRVKNL